VEASETSVCWTLLDGWKDVDSDLISLVMISYFPIKIKKILRGEHGKSSLGTGSRI
jgi:hypothetical protein